MPNPKDTKEELESRTKEQLLDYVYDLHKSLMACGIYSVPMFGVADAVQQRTHFPGCHKVHIECANKAIDEARQILDGEAFLKERGLRLATEWLGRWRVKE